MDTDCVVITGVLTTSKELGDFKLEATYEGLNLGPKSYIKRFQDRIYDYKFKGFRNQIPWNEVLKLIDPTLAIELEQIKYASKLEGGKVYLNYSSYSAKATDNKRDFILDQNGKNRWYKASLNKIWIVKLSLILMNLIFLSIERKTNLIIKGKA